MEDGQSIWMIISSVDCVICHVELRSQVSSSCHGFFIQFVDI